MPYVPLPSEPTPRPERRDSGYTEDLGEVQNPLRDLEISWDSVNTNRLEKRREISQLCTTYRDNAWTAVNTLTRNLLDAEDQYRQVGTRYYTGRDPPDVLGGVLDRKKLTAEPFSSFGTTLKKS
jgi:hypothetical protein